MNKRERFFAFLGNQPVDRVPVAFFHHFCSFDEFNQGVVNETAFEHNIEGHRRAKAIFDPDVAKIMTDSLMIMPLDCSFVEKPSDLSKIELPAMNSPFVKKTQELTKRVRDIYADSDAPVFATSFSPYTLLRGVISPTGKMVGQGGEESLFQAFMEEDPESVSAALGRIGERISEINESLIRECGADGIYLSVNNQSVLSDDLHRTYVAPHEKEILARANALSNCNLLHICGGPLNVASSLDLYADYPVAAFNWAIQAEHVTLGEGKKLLDGRPVFGGFERTGVLDQGSREEVEKRVFQILDECGQTGIMLGCDCTVPIDIDDNRLEWVRQAAIKYAER